MTLRRPCALWAGCREKVRHLRLRGAVGTYADGELTGRRRARVAAHIARCRPCGGTFRAVRMIKASVRRSPHRAPVPLASRRLRRYAERLADGREPGA